MTITSGGLFALPTDALVVSREDGALTTVPPVSPWTRRMNVAALVVAVGLAYVDIVA